MTLHRSALLALAPLLFTTVTACAGAQVKDGSADGKVNVVLRRIDVVEADFDRMKLNVIVAIENGTGSDFDASADASIALVGEAKDAAAADAGDSGDDDAGAEAP